MITLYRFHIGAILVATVGFACVPFMASAQVDPLSITESARSPVSSVSIIGVDDDAVELYAIVQHDGVSNMQYVLSEAENDTEPECSDAGNRDYVYDDVSGVYDRDEVAMFEIHNLKDDTGYYIRICGTFSGQVQGSAVYSFIINSESANDDKVESLFEYNNVEVAGSIGVNPVDDIGGPIADVLPNNNRAVTAEDAARARIAELLAQIAQLEALLRAQNGLGTAPASADSFVFIHDLEVGMTHPDVVRLQRYLNQRGYYVQTHSKPGAPGYETDYFGELTRQALVRFQVANGIGPADGYFGPLTRSVIDGI